MTKDQAIKFKEWITDYVDIDVQIMDGRYLVLDFGVCCEVDVHLAYRGRRYIVDEFIYEGGRRESFPIRCRTVAKYARLRLDNGVKRVLTKRPPHLKLDTQDDKWIMIQHESDKEALSYLDDIIAKPKQFWLKVIYHDGGLHLIDKRGEILSPAHTKGTIVGMVSLLTGVICKFVIKGYDDEDQDEDDLSGVPVLCNDFYKYCLLEEIK